MGKQLFVIGLGLIGGSLALAVKKDHPDTHVTGYDLNKNVMKAAISLGVINESAPSIEEGARHADLIIVAAPVKETIEILRELSSLPLKEEAIITDVGSTKKAICEASHVFDHVSAHFIGGHPMAGSHKSGVEAAKSHLFENAYYIITPVKETDARAVIQLQNWLKGTKARFIQLTPGNHDFFAGMVSHFPHIVASGLVHQLKEEGEKEPVLNNLAAGGFRDITRIASSSPVMWRDILLSNRDVLLGLIDKWQEEMNKVKGYIEKEDAERLFEFFDVAKQSRDALPVRKKGAIPSFYDLYVDVPDHPGVISDVTAILAKKQISITNIRILETREDIMGVLRLSFRSENDQLLAKEQLTKHMYEAYESP
ncbi:prephenate dehydrogenase [Alteribacter keqinensis]|uniref:Prephenate dehydrogenase n=1 Tax=Alteribacter keqinensis TaxID=2483800 RepID=A0A3M7TUL8_9BACI|nr:prephenate dehydrogenase [Alteribacter keqinensis]RNA69153.1 prephenate dehydrogenase [Alteribacter keqinensis]